VAARKSRPRSKPTAVSAPMGWLESAANLLKQGNSNGGS
jgi:hypothetical protein